MDLPDFAVSTAAVAELALVGFDGSDENATITLDALTIREDNDFADSMAAEVGIAVIGLTNPLESMVPVMVLVVGPSGPSVVMVVVIITGVVNREDGNGLKVVLPVEEEALEVSGGRMLVPVDPGAGGWEGKGIGENPVVLVLGCVGIQATPPGPTTIVVSTPSIVVVIVDAVVIVVNGGRVDSVKVTSDVIEPSMAVIVMTVLDGAGWGVCDVVGVAVGLRIGVIGEGPGAAVVDGTIEEELC